MWNERTRGWWKGRAREYSRRAYRYATPSAINISGGKKKKKKKMDGRGQGRKAQWRKSWAWHLQWNEERALLPFSFSSSSSSSSSSSLSFSCPRLSPFHSLSLFLPSTPLFPYIPLLDSPPTSKFTLYRRSTKPLGPFRALLKIEDAICLAGLRRRPTCSK